MKLTGRISSKTSVEAGASWAASSGAVRADGRQLASDPSVERGTVSRTDRQRLDSRDREEGYLPPLVAKPKKVTVSAFFLARWRRRRTHGIACIDSTECLESLHPEFRRIKDADNLLVGATDKLEPFLRRGERDGSERVAVNLRSAEFCKCARASLAFLSRCFKTVYERVTHRARSRRPFRSPFSAKARAVAPTCLD